MSALPMQNLIRRSGPVGVLLVLFIVCLSWLSVMRGVLVAMNWSRLQDVPDVWWVFVIGLRMDTIVLCQLFAIPAVLLLLSSRRWVESIVAVLLTAFAVLLLKMELTTPNFIAEYDRRPDRIYYEYLRYPQEVAGTLFKTYPLQLLMVIVLTGCLGYAFWRLCRRQMSVAQPWSWQRRLVALPLIVVLMFVGIRSTFGHRPANMSTAAYSNNHLLNELAVSSTYSLFTAIYMSREEVDAKSVYAPMDSDEALRRVRHYIGNDVEFINTKVPTLHRQGESTNPRPPNLVIIALESLGAGFVGRLGGLPLTPNIDRLADEGLWFTQLYATGTRTARGLEALTTGFPPTAAPPVLKLPAAQRDFFTLAGLLGSHGYTTEFIYGGVSNFDNMGSFFKGNGFARIIEQRDFEKPALLGTWGVSDEDLAIKAHETFLAHGDQPFFALLLSTSNHVPFEFPQDRIDLHEQPAGTRNNAVKYTDYAIGKFFELAKSAPYFSNTIFLVVADHDARVYGADLVPVEHFRIPGLIIGPHVPKREEARVASQIDLAPTLLGLMGIETMHPMIGRDVLNLPAGTPGRAIMQYGEANGFWVGDRVVIHRPHQPAQTFTYLGKGLVPAARDEELERDALAHLVWADNAYRQRQYQLPAIDWAQPSGLISATLPAPAKTNPAASAPTSPASPQARMATAP